MDYTTVCLPSGKRLSELKVAALQKELSRRRLSKVGKKQELIIRLAQFLTGDMVHNKDDNSAMDIEMDVKNDDHYESRNIKSVPEEPPTSLFHRSPLNPCNNVSPARTLGSVKCPILLNISSDGEYTDENGRSKTPVDTCPLDDVTERKSSRKCRNRRSGTFDVPLEESIIAKCDQSSTIGSATRPAISPSQSATRSSRIDISTRRSSDIRRSIVRQIGLDRFSAEKEATCATDGTPSNLLQLTPKTPQTGLRKRNSKGSSVRRFISPTVSSSLKTHKSPLLGRLLSRSPSPNTTANIGHAKKTNIPSQSRSSVKRFPQPTDENGSSSALKRTRSTSSKAPTLPPRPVTGPRPNRFAAIHQKILERGPTIEESRANIESQHAEMNRNLPDVVKRLATPKRSSRIPSVTREINANSGFVFGVDPHAPITSDMLQFGNSTNYANIPKVQPSTMKPLRPLTGTSASARKAEQRNVKEITRKAHTARRVVHPLTIPEDNTFANYISVPKGVTPNKGPTRKYTPRRGALGKFVDTAKLSDRDFQLAVQAGLVKGAGSTARSRPEPQTAAQAQSNFRRQKRDELLDVRRKLNL